MKRTWLGSLVLCCCLGALGARQLGIDQIMEGEDFVGVSPSQVRWNGNGTEIFFRWRQPGEKKRATYAIKPDGSGLRRLTEEEEKQAWPRFGDWNRDFTQFLFVREGALFLLDAAGNRRQLTRTRAAESNPRFTQDQQAIFFTRDGNLFLMPLDGPGVSQLTDFRQGAAPKEKELTASQKYLKKEQEGLFKEFSGEKKKEREEQEKKRKERDARAFYLARGQSASDLLLSPDRKYVLFRWSQRAGRARRTIVPDFVTEDGYTRDINSRTKVGDQQNQRRLGIYRIEDGKVTWVEKDRAFSVISEPRWNEKGDRCAFMAVSADFKDRWLMTVDEATGQTRIVDHLHDDAWIGGPGWLTFGWLPDGTSLYFISERDGWAHLYTVGADGSGLKQLTRGSWEVHWVHLSRDHKHWYLVTSEQDLGERHLYRMDLQGGPRTRLTSMEGREDAILSPDEAQVAFLHSSSNRPPELYVQKNEAGAQPHRLTESTTAEFRAYPWQIPDFVTIPARDGVQVPARFYKTSHPAAGNPAVIFVHGAGYLQNAHRWWSSYYREYMFHHFLMEHGYSVLDVDYRGSAGYGRDWRTAIYRHMGGTDLTDQVDAAHWLVQKQGVDPHRIGIYGGSYGGFITLMAMFTKPGVFAAGAALRPVTDWAHYNHPYTGRILNLPQDDPEAYRQSSPIFFADGLKGALLICHGMADTNVHFQDTVRLVQRLIELRKENWQVAVYPEENHGFRNPTSWADEYKRIFNLFEQNLK